jgi:hypothetical protein
MKIAGFLPQFQTPSRPRAAAPNTEPAGDTYTPSLTTAQSPEARKGPGIATLIGRGLAVALVATLALSGPAALAANLPSRVEMQTASGKMHPPMAPGGVAHDKTPNQIREATANSLTEQQIPAGKPHYRAAEPNQTSKRYYQPEIEGAIQQARQTGTLTPAKLAQLMTQYQSQNGGTTVRQGTSFRYCVSQHATNLTCNAAITNQLSYTLLSCQYKNAQGKVETVLHRSMDHQYTPAMQRSVCGGHRLEADKSSGFTEWKPTQLSPDGAPLYLNPNNIIAVLPH